MKIQLPKSLIAVLSVTSMLITQAVTAQSIPGPGMQRYGNGPAPQQMTPGYGSYPAGPGQYYGQGGQPWNNGGWGGGPWNNNGGSGGPWNNNGWGGGSPWNNNGWGGGSPWNNNGWGGGSPWNNNGWGGGSPWNNNGWGGGSPWNNNGPYGGGPQSWMQPGDPKGSVSRMWDDMLNAPSEMGTMPGGWNAPSISVPNPVEVADEMDEAVNNMNSGPNN